MITITATSKETLYSIVRRGINNAAANQSAVEVEFQGAKVTVDQDTDSVQAMKSLKIQQLQNKLKVLEEQVKATK